MEEVVSVIIPVYERPEVTKTIRSALRQTYGNIKVLVIDDGSGPDVKDAILSNRDPRILYHRLEQNGNANIARNLGIKLAKGEYISFLDSDDFYTPTHIAECIKLLREERVDGLYGSIHLGVGMQCRRTVYASPLNPHESMPNYLVRRGYGACTSSLFMSRKSALAVMWDESLHRHQDYDFLTRYHERFSLAVKRHPTVIYNISAYKKNPKPIDFESCIRWSGSVKDKIEPQVYKWYISAMLEMAKKKDAHANILKYYQRELNLCDL